MKQIKTLFLVFAVTSVSGLGQNCDEDLEKCEFSKATFSRGVGFYDFDTDRKAFATKEGGWSSSSPAWRIWHDGANLEGYCRNPECPAHNKKVISPLGLGNFLIVKDGGYTRDFLCPVCSKSIVPRTCGFTGCHYKMKGKKNDKGIMSRPWQTKGRDGFILFNEEVQGVAEFSDIRIEAKALTENKPEDDDI